MGIYIFFSKASVPSVIACAILALAIIFIDISTLEIEETKQEEITLRRVK